MKQYFLTSLILIAAIFQASSQSTMDQLGARAASMAYTASTLKDSWSIFNNPAGLSSVKEEITAVFAFENRFAIEGLNVIGAGVSSALPVGTFGISVLKFGDDLYNEQGLSFSYANKFGIAGLGCRVNYVRFHLEGYGDKGIVTLDFGGVAEVTKKLYFGAYIRNINQAQISEFQDERAPTILYTGLSYRPTNKIILNIEAEKDIDYTANVKLGLEYKFFKKFFVRTGAKISPFTQFFGFGFANAKLHIDYALVKEKLLGICHQAAITYKLRKSG